MGGLVRQNFREATNIQQGSYLSDCLHHCGHMHAVSLCQELNELKLRAGNGFQPNKYGIVAGQKYNVQAIKDAMDKHPYAYAQAQAHGQAMSSANSTYAKQNNHDNHGQLQLSPLSPSITK